TVNREGLWMIVSKLRCPPKLVKIICLFHEGMQGQVLLNGDLTDSFLISNGVKQGCVLTPVLFNLFFTKVLNHATDGLNRGIYIRYRHDGSVFTLTRLKAKTKVTELLIREALFADDCAFLAHTEGDLQCIVDRFAEASNLFGLTINLEKTVMLHQSSPPLCAISTSISISGNQLKQVDIFTYLSSNISHDGSLDKEIMNRIQKASQSFGKLCNKVLKSHNITLSTKIKLSLLCGCETWTPYKWHIKQLEAFRMQSLHTIMEILWQDKITNLEVLQKSNAMTIEDMLIKAQLCWVGHIIRMPEY
ncbi:hypothetical protein G0U57_013140, partial [Chelydra serpentina]